MRLVVDLQGAQGENRGRGIGRYAQSLTEAIIRHPGRHEVQVLLNAALEGPDSGLQRHFIDLLGPAGVSVWQPGQAGEQSRERHIADLAPDAVLVSSLFEGIVTPAFTSVPASDAPPTAVVVYDLIPLVLRERYLDGNPAYERWYQEKLSHLRRADRLLAISETTRRDCLARLELPDARVVAIGGGVDPRFGLADPDIEDGLALRRRLGLTKPFVLYVGGIDPRKNIEGLIDAFADLPPAVRRSHQIAIVCAASDGDRARLLRHAAEAGLPAGALTVAGAVSDDDLAALYAMARLFVFPSFYEGLGLPALEAMACGTPVIASNGGSLPEVIGRADALFPPGDRPLFTARLLAALADRDWRGELRRHGLERVRAFTWEATAGKALTALGDMVSQRRKAAPLRTEGKPRLAYVSPLPPAASGIADYSAELLPELARHYDIETITSAEQLDAGFDRILYHIGNSDHHAWMFPLLESHPGVVALHDVHLGHIFAHLQRTGAAPGAWDRALYASHGYAALTGNRDEAVMSFPGSFEVLAAARGTIVHSAFARGIIARWFLGLAEDQVEIVPHLRSPVPTPDRARARRALGVAENTFLICSFGGTGALKLNHRLVDAFLASEAGRSGDTRLVFVGALDANEYGQALSRQIDAAGGRVAVTDHAPRETYRDYLAAADLAVQLRSASRGETSGGLLDCQNHGLATIVNAHGAWAETPAGTALLIPDAFTDAELSAAIDRLWRDAEERKRLGAAAVGLIQAEHAPKTVASRYAAAIEGFYARSLSRPAPQPSLLVDVTDASEPERAEMIRRWAASPPAGWRVEPVREEGGLLRFDRQRTLDVLGAQAQLDDAPMNARRADRLVPYGAFSAAAATRHLWVDVSELAVRDARTGIQRVVRNILRRWLDSPPPGWRIEPVHAAHDQPYRLARRFTADFLGRAPQGEDELLAVEPGDCFVGLDLQPTVVPIHRAALEAIRRRGAVTAYVVYDLLCVERPEWFAPGADATFSRWLDCVADADGAVCISAAVADSLRRWVGHHRPDAAPELQIDHFRLGGDFERAEAAADAPWRAPPPGPVILMVGTLEPRKGHAAAVAAAERLWAAGEDFSLVIAGKPGWMVERLVEYIRRHPEKDRRLFWYPAASDAQLAGLYAAAHGLLLTSEGEGFGLPLLEAGRYALPVLARDLPVFREVAGDSVRYFGADLVADWRRWLHELRDGTAPRSDAIPATSWEESAAQLFERISAIWQRRVTR